MIGSGSTDRNVVNDIFISLEGYVVKEGLQIISDSLHCKLLGLGLLKLCVACINGTLGFIKIMCGLHKWDAYQPRSHKA